VIGNPNPINGRHIHDPEFEPLWDAIEELGVPIGFHPTGQSSLRDDIARRYLDHPNGRVIGVAGRNPMELMMAFGSMAAGGVLERHPRLRCAFLEGTCGWLPWWLWRLDEAWEKFGPGSEVQISQLPSQYFFRQCYVATDADEKVLKQVVEAVGDDNIVVSTDYPHSDGLFPHAIEEFVALEGVSDKTKAKILWDNCARLYNLPVLTRACAAPAARARRRPPGCWRGVAGRRPIAIDDYIRGEMTARRIPGLALAVVRDGAVVKLQGYGVANLEHDVPVTPDTVFELASLTKQFTASAIMTLVEDGRLSSTTPSRPTSRTVPETWKAITVRHLLTHTSGLPELADGFGTLAAEPGARAVLHGGSLRVRHQGRARLLPGRALPVQRRRLLSCSACSSRRRAASAGASISTRASSSRSA
jgi:hypothetical protein